MSEYRFDQIAIVSTEKKKPTDADKENYIGLEHLSPDTFDVVDYGSEVAPKGEKLVMRKGDVLFGKRRAYQKKVGIAPCDGIFSAHGMVLRPNEEVIDARFFPFFIKSDAFLDEAIRISVGSLSPTVNWRDLRELRFNLPPMERQRELADLLWAGEDLRSTYRRLLNACDEQVKSRFIEMFGENGDKFQCFSLGELCETRLGKMLDVKRQAGEMPLPYLTNHNVYWNEFDLTQVNEMEFDEQERETFRLHDGDILVCEGRHVGRCAIWHNEIEECYYQKALHRVRCDTSRIVPEYMAWFLRHLVDSGRISRYTTGNMIPHMPHERFITIDVWLPDIASQREFAAFVAQVDKSEFLHEFAGNLFGRILRAVN